MVDRLSVHARTTVLKDRYSSTQFNTEGRLTPVHAITLTPMFPWICKIGCGDLIVRSDVATVLNESLEDEASRPKASRMSCPALG